MSFTVTEQELSPERVAFREALMQLRVAIREDCGLIRAGKQKLAEAVKISSGSIEQRDLNHLRRDARVRLLLYGFLRGQEWARIESNHEDGVAFLRIPLKMEWIALQKRVVSETDFELEAPEMVAKYAR